MILTLTFRFSGLRAILSGPAGGVVGHARTSFDITDGTPIIGYVKPAPFYCRHTYESVQCKCA